MLKRFLVLVVVLSGILLLGSGIDNSLLMPKYKPDSEVVMEARADGASESPDWVKSLIWVEIRVDSVIPGGTIKDLVPVLDHLAEMGVNGLWVSPPLAGGNGYGNFGIHTFSSRLLGEKDRERQWQVLKDFVDEAHQRNIRVFFDFINWGVTKHEGGSPLHREKPEWFGEYFPRYSGWLFNWDNPELNEWYSEQLVEWAMRTGMDGFRCDCAPFYSGYSPFEVAKKKLFQAGRKVIFISEHGSSRKNVFDFDQVAFCYKDEKNRQRVRWTNDLYLTENMVDMVKNGTELRMRDDFEHAPGRERFYTFMLSCHDSRKYVVNGSLITMGYQAIFSPFLPLWYIGEEWNNPYAFYVDYFYQRDKHVAPESWRIYYNKIDWNVLEDNRAFYEQVKLMIRIRRSYPDIFEYFPDDHTQTNICKVRTNRSDLIQAYARFRNGRAILVIPNNGSEATEFKVELPFQEAGLKANAKYMVKDLLGDKEIATGIIKSFKCVIPANGLEVYLLVSVE